jgi:hypothetical protein
MGSPAVRSRFCTEIARARSVFYGSRVTSSLRTLSFVVVALAALASTGAAAQDFVGTRALALGEAYRSIASSNDAIYFNPAGLSQLPRYSPEVHYKLNLNEEEHQADISVVDSKTSQMAAGLAYTFDGRQFSKRASLQHTATLALAYPFFEQMLCVGAGLKYVNVWDAVVGNYLNALSADVGFLSKLPGGVALAAVGYNLIPIRSARVPMSAGFSASLDLGPLSALIFGGGPSFGPMQTSGGVPSMVPGGMVGPLSGLTVAFDWHLRFFSLEGPQHRLSGGIEYLLLEMVPLRAGYQWQQETDNHLVSVGTGFIVPYFGLDVAYQQSVNHFDTRTFAISLKFFLPL